jgi:hypothetical protein
VPTTFREDLLLSPTAEVENRLMGHAEPDWRQLDYEQTLQTYRQLAEIRFKLLALVPTLSGIAVALITSATLERSQKAALAALGFVVVLGIVIYDQRNSQFYNGAIGRAQFLECELGLASAPGDEAGGLFRSREGHPTLHLFSLPVRHGLGLALIYSPVFGAWVFAGVYAIWPSHAWLAAISGAAVTALFLGELLRLDGMSVRRWWHRRKKARGAGTSA